MCTANHYNRNSDICQYFDNFSNKFTAKQYEYNFWPKDELFLTYSNRDNDEIFREDIMQSEFTAGRIVNITLARYSYDGAFIGFKVLELDVEKCPEQQDSENIWRKFGSNYYSKCAIDLYEQINITSNEYFDPFIQDNLVGTTPVLRPIPVRDLNFVNSDRSLTNTNNNGSTSYFYGRRFFIMDDVTTESYIQYLKQISITFKTSSIKQDKISIPYIDVEYVQIPRNFIKLQSPSYESLKASYSTPEYQFNVYYTSDMDTFWEVTAILFSMVIIFGLFIFAYVAFVFIKKHAIAGFNGYVIMGVIHNLLDAFGNIFTVLVFGYSMYFFFFFKLQSGIVTYLPPGEKFDYLIPFAWVAFGFKFVASILKVLQVSSNEFLIIDWSQEDKKIEEAQVWRRLLISNEFLKLQNTRFYNMPFTILIIVLLQIAVKLQLFASPIPDTDLVFTGIYAMILQVGWLAILFCSLFIIEYVVTNIWWLIFNSPFKKFADLCLSQNISVLVSESSVHGYYIHGCTKDSERSMIEMQSSNLQGAKPKEPDFILIDAQSNCFEFFLEPEFSRRLTELYKTVSAQVGGSLFKQTAASLPSVCLGAYADLNKFLQSFFTPGQTIDKLELKYERTATQKILRMPPTITDSTILQKVSGTSYKRALVYGEQVRIYFMHAILFCALDMHLKNPVIAGFIILVVDYLLKLFWTLRGKQNLSRKALLENRFII